jgi:hypothetical protein
VIRYNGKLATRYEHWYGQNPQFANHLRTWGEAGTVKIKTSTTPKLNNKGVACMFIGYATDHKGDCYRMWNPKTSRVHTTRDVFWLKRMFFTVKSPNNEIQVEPTLEEEIDKLSPDYVTSEVGESESKKKAKTTQIDEDDDEKSVESFDDSKNDTEIKPRITDTVEDNRVRKVTAYGREIKRPEWFAESEYSGVAMQPEMQMTTAENKFYTTILEMYQAGKMGQEEMSFVSENVTLVGAAGAGFINTKELMVMKYDEAMASPDKKHWEEAVMAEKEKMDKYKVLKERWIKDLPQHAKILTTTWAMKKKANGVFRA